MNKVIIEEKDIDIDKMYRCRDTGQLLYVGNYTIGQWIKNNKIKGSKKNNIYYIKGSDLIDFISNNRDALNKRKKNNEKKILRDEEYQKENRDKEQKYWDYQNTKSGAFINLSDLPEELTEWHEYDKYGLDGNFEYDVKEETSTDILISKKSGGPYDYYNNLFNKNDDDDINTAIKNGGCKWFSKEFVKVDDDGDIFIRKWLFEKDEFFKNSIEQINNKSEV